MRICPKCQFENSDEQAFCTECGTSLAETEIVEKEPVTPTPVAVEPKKEDKLSVLSFTQQNSVVEEEPIPEPKPEKEPEKPASETLEEDDDRVIIPTEEERNEQLKAQRKAEIKALPKAYRPVSLVYYLFLDTLFFIIPFVISGLLNYFYGNNANALMQALFIVLAPAISLIFLIFFAFVPKNESVKNFTKSQIILLLIIVVIILISFFTGGLKQAIQYLAGLKIFH